ncbi:hypothetical protein AVEN_151607-1 [Araneus ventricosus]|uniref:Uncharacterized protein n=1 Tax=Araneus ventricosus TaxID=182803 RepID=A0A4Y2UA89_ARAVE|nr:hypothetical protein AVEN_151607-1 [Araneus ventricosus]
MYLIESCHWLIVQSLLPHTTLTPLYLQVLNCSFEVTPDWLQKSTFASPPLLLPDSRLVPHPTPPPTRPRSRKHFHSRTFYLSPAASYSRLWLAALTSRRHHEKYLSFVRSAFTL